jgi:predicted acetyltransferase
MSDSRSLIRPQLVLRELTDRDETAFLDGFAAWDQDGDTPYAFAWKPGEAFLGYLDRLKHHYLGVGLPESWVPSSMLYGFAKGVIVGRVSIRHRLNDFLRWKGGHIGYGVAPCFRRQGYATEMLRQALGVCRVLRLDRVMLTCDVDNVASWLVIERCGGLLEEQFSVKGKFMRRYWIDLGDSQ